MSRPQRQSPAHRRREAALRASLCRQVAIRRGYRHVCPLIDLLAEYASLGSRLPFASQQTMATELGVTDRTIRNWLVVLEALTVVEVFRSRPMLRHGRWTRRTNRYLLCDRRAAAAPRVCPLPRRRGVRVAETSPTGNEIPLTSTRYEPMGVDPGVDDPPAPVAATVGDPASASSNDGRCAGAARPADPAVARRFLAEARAHLRRPPS